MPFSRPPSANGTGTGVVLWINVGRVGHDGNVPASWPNARHLHHEDPYSAMADLCRRPDEIDVVVLSLSGLYREELRMIPAIRRASPRVEVWLTDIDGRPAALAEGMRLGADGLLGEEGMHRLSSVAPGETDTTAPAPTSHEADSNQGLGSWQSTEAREPSVRRIAESDAVTGTSTGNHSPGLATALDDLADPVMHRNGTRRRVNRRDAASAPPPAQPEPTGYQPSDPLLTADELRALLHDPSNNEAGG